MFNVNPYAPKLEGSSLCSYNASQPAGSDSSKIKFYSLGFPNPTRSFVITVRKSVVLKEIFTPIY
jgi:hypothetical protein